MVHQLSSRSGMHLPVTRCRDAGLTRRPHFPTPSQPALGERANISSLGTCGNIDSIIAANSAGLALCSPRGSVIACGGWVPGAGAGTAPLMPTSRCSSWSRCDQLGPAWRSLRDPDDGRDQDGDDRGRARQLLSNESQRILQRHRRHLYQAFKRLVHLNYEKQGAADRSSTKDEGDHDQRVARCIIAEAREDQREPDHQHGDERNIE